MKNLNYIMRYGTLLLALVVSFSASAVVTIKLLGGGPVWSPIYVSGSITGADYNETIPTSGGPGSTRLFFWVQAYKNGAVVWRSINYEVIVNGMAVNTCHPDTRELAVQTTNYHLAKGLTINDYADPLRTEFDRLALRAQIECRNLAVGDGGTRYQMSDFIDVEVVNPPFPPVTPASVCSLSNNVSLSYSSTTLNVNGLSQGASLGVSCTSGTAQDYTLRLTGSSVSGGRLSFGNNVSAQVYLNGTAVSANGSGIRLNSLTSRSVPVRADLVGTATNSGTTMANGVLVLEAL